MVLGETLDACRALHNNAEQIIDEELTFIRDDQVRLIAGDIPPLCFEIAARAGIPSTAITNFTWNWIYRAYLRQHPDFLPLIEEMETFYGKATLSLTLPYPCNMNVFPCQEAIPWITRLSSLTKEQSRTKFRLPQSATIVLLSFGGIGLTRLPWDRLKQLRDFYFVATGESREIGDNVLILPDTQRQYEDLLRAVDLIVTKPGYGIVADVIAHRVPMLYTDRGEFPEYPRLVEALNDCATAEFIPQSGLLSGNIAPYLRKLLEKKRNWPEVALDGAQVAADKILALMDGNE
jgi:hypothetical protein